MTKEEIGYLIKIINDKMKSKIDADLKNYNLTFAQGRVLAFINKKGGQATQKEIEIFLNVSHPTVVGIVSRLEQNGYAESFTDSSDKRNKIVKMTQSAKKMEAKIRRDIVEAENKMTYSLSDSEVKELRRMLMIVYTNLE